MIILLNTILFIYQFEFLGYEGLTVYRCLIFPLLVFGLLKYKIKIRERDLNLLCIVFLLFIIRLISSFSYGAYWSLVDVIGQAVQFIFAYSFIQSYKLEKSTLWILSTWSFFHLLCFLTGTDILIREYMGKSTDLGGRFCGFHWDPNYLCAWLLVAMWAKIYLLKSIERVYLKIILILFVVLDVSMVFSTLSKGGILTLTLTSLFYFIIYNKKIAIIITSFIVLFGIYIGSIYTQLGWGESSLVNRVIYRMFTQSVETGDFTSSRYLFYINYFNMIKYSGVGVVSGIPEEYFVSEYNNDMYPHSLIIGFWIFGGFLFGSIFMLILSYIILKGCIMSFFFETIPFLLMFSLVFFFVFFNLSIGGLKITWLFIGIFFALSNKETFIKQLENVKTFNSRSRL